MTTTALRTAEWRRRLLRRHVLAAAAAMLLRLAAAAGIAALVLLLVVVARDGLDRLSWDFITSYPSRIATRAGIRSALLGSLWVVGLTGLLAVPVGIGVAEAASAACTAFGSTVVVSSSPASAGSDEWKSRS